MKKRVVLVFPLSLISAACTVAPSAEQSAEDPVSTQQPERWSTADDPALFMRDMERNLEKLPMQGSASSIPWAGSYWPMAYDSINYRWDGADSLSPAKKYEKAFGGSRVEDRVSQYYGIVSQPSARVCTKDSQCNKSLVEVCGKRAGESTGRCIPDWYGICDAWAAASILFPEPKHAVVMNGVTFKVQDIKALISMVSTKITTKFVSLRCESNDSTSGIRYDAYGRPAAQECRDSNPGTFHLILANYLGRQGKSVVEDRTFDYQVWNQPIRSYQVVGSRKVSAQEANRLVAGGGPTRYLFNPDAISFVHVQNNVSYILESTPETDGPLIGYIDTFTGSVVYEYILEINRKGAIIGGEWVGESKRNHPDFVWLPTGLSSAPVAGGAIRAEQIKALSDASIAP
jgi:hypothetical protein